MASKAAPPAALSPVGSSSPSTASAPAGAALTLKQQAVYDLKLAGKTRAEIASIRGVSPSVVSKTLQSCYKKLGLTRAARLATTARTLEETNPEKAAALIDAITEPEAIVKLKQAYKDAGLPETVSGALLKRIKAKYYGAITQTRNLKASEIAQLFSEKIDLAARYMDDKTAGEASFRDLALASTAMAEKRQLMRGEPTQIISDAERKKLHELMPLLISEGQRRGITVNGEVTAREVTVEPSRTSA